MGLLEENFIREKQRPKSNLQNEISIPKLFQNYKTMNLFMSVLFYKIFKIFILT